MTILGLMSGMGVSFILFVILCGLAFLAFVIWMQWQVLEKAGFSGALALLLLLGVGLGYFIIQIIMTFSRWSIEDQMDALRAGAPPQPLGGPPMTTSV
ncbi:MAG TPA: hypothetical protein VIJ12_04050 [Candidatus Baltobacteraceae bacterium]